MEWEELQCSESIICPACWATATTDFRQESFVSRHIVPQAKADETDCVWYCPFLIMPLGNRGILLMTNYEGDMHV